MLIKIPKECLAQPKMLSAIQYSQMYYFLFFAVSVFHWFLFYSICYRTSVILLCLCYVCLSIITDVLLFIAVYLILNLTSLLFFYSVDCWNCKVKLFISVNLNRKFGCLKQSITKVKVVSPSGIICICSNIKNFSLNYLWHLNISSALTSLVSAVQKK